MAQPNSPPPKTNHPRRQVPKARYADDKPHRQRGTERRARFQSLKKSPLLVSLSALDNPRRGLPTPLDFRELAIQNAARAQWFGEDIRRFRGISNRAVDTYSTHRQHDVGSIADQQ